MLVEIPPAGLVGVPAFPVASRAVSVDPAEVGDPAAVGRA